MRQSGRKRENKEVGIKRETDRNEEIEKKKKGMLRPGGSKSFQMIASHKVVFYTASDLLSIYGSGY